jgi:3-methyladenine DNA glycosylase Tag
MPSEPDRINPKNLADYLAVMTKSAFQSGMGYAVIEAKWDGFVEAFEGFDPEVVAEFEEPDVERLVQDTRIIRNRKKIEATIHNAETLLRLSGGTKKGLQKWLRGFEDYPALEGAIRKEFKFLGKSGIYIWLYIVGEDVPDHTQVLS